MTVAGWVVVGLICSGLVVMICIAAWIEGLHPPDIFDDGFTEDKDEDN